MSISGLQSPCFPHVEGVKGLGLMGPCMPLEEEKIENIFWYSRFWGKNIILKVSFISNMDTLTRKESQLVTYCTALTSTGTPLPKKHTFLLDSLEKKWENIYNSDTFSYNASCTEKMFRHVPETEFALLSWNVLELRSIKLMLSNTKKMCFCKLIYDSWICIQAKKLNNHCFAVCLICFLGII